MELENKIQAKIINELKKRGYYVVKVILCNKNGFPDLMILKNGVTFFIEVKTEIGKQSELQIQRQIELEKLGFKYYVVRNLNELHQILK